VSRGGLVDKRGRLVGGLLAVLGWAGLLVCAGGDRSEAARGYLTAFVWLSGLPLGALAFLMMQHATGGRWGRRLGPLLRAAAATTPFLIALFLPLLLALPQIYPWARPEEVAHSRLWLHRAGYMNPAGFAIRGLAALLLWSYLAWRLQTRMSTPRLQKMACVGLALHLFLTGLLSVDWMMSLDESFRSSVYGLIFMVLQGLSAFSLLTALACATGPGGGDLYDLGGLLLAQVMLLGYLSFSQIVVIWAGNLAEEAPWLETRVFGAWSPLGLGLLLIQLFLPFLLLSWGAIKRAPSRLGAISAAVALLCPLDALWLVAPSFHPGAMVVTPAFLLALLALGGSWWVPFSALWSRQRSLEELA
jgi:hypothetical protein